MKRNSQLESCVLESDGDTEDEEDSDGNSHAQRDFICSRFKMLHLLDVLKGFHV